MTMPFQPAAFPYARPRRLRSQPWVRRLVAETTLTPADLIWPIIVHDGTEDRVPVASMPDVFRLSPKEAAKAAVEARDLGIPMIALFPNVNDSLKDNVGTAASDRPLRTTSSAWAAAGTASTVAIHPSARSACATAPPAAIATRAIKRLAKAGR